MSPPVISHQTAVKFDPLDQTTSYLPETVALQILSNLSVDELGNCALLCKFWSALVSHPDLLNYLDLRTVFSKLRIIDQQAWKDHVDLEKYNLSFNGLPKIENQTLIRGLRKFSSLPIEGDAGFTYLTIPAGLSIKKLEQIASDSDKAIFDPLWPKTKQQLEDVVTTQSYTVLISHSVLEGSRETRDQALVNGYGCEMPGVLDAATLLFITYMMTEERLYPDMYKSDSKNVDGQRAITYTRCLEQVNGKQVIVGNFSSVGLRVRTFRTFLGLYGVAAFQKLS